MDFGTPQIIVLLVAAQRLAELGLAAHNTRRLLSQGGQEVGARHYPLIVLLHGGWLVALFVSVAAGTPVSWPLIGVFVALQAARLWVIATLGRFWTTRIITIPGAPLVRTGPYRWLRHPNYWIVSAEMAVLPLAFGAWTVALSGSVLNALVLRHRIRVEEATFKERR